MDTDGDDVPNAIDLCSNTPIGEPVDADGCSASQLDGDGDGVPDSVDQCPSEDATGLDLDLDGCKDTAADLIQLTQSFGLPLGISTSLVAKLQQAANANSIQAATALLEAFKNEVEAQRGMAIGNEQADLLVAMADNVLAQL